MKQLILILAMILSASVSARGMSGWEATLQFSYESTDFESTENGVVSTGEASNIPLFLKFGYNLGTGLYLGGVYHTRAYEDGNGVSTTEETDSLMGATIGYHGENWFADFSYFLMGTFERGDEEFDSNSGYQLDLGYRSWISNNFGLAAILTYRSITRDDYTNLGVQSDREDVSTQIKPYLGLVARF